MPELKGQISNLLEPETGEGRNGTWIKQSFVVTYGEEIERNACFTLFGERKVALLDQAGEGDYVSVSFNIDSKPGKSESTSNKYFTELNAWKIEIISKAHRPQYSAPAPDPAPSTAPAPKAAPAPAPAPKAAPAPKSAVKPNNNFFDKGYEEENTPW
jgi:hypothetical protein